MEHPNVLGPMLCCCAHLSRERMDARLAQYGTTPSQTHAILYLHRHGGSAPQCEIVEHLKVKPSTANGILDRLEEKGLVARSVSESDARRRLVTLTEKGAALHRQLQSAFDEMEALMMQNLSPQEREQIFSCLKRIILSLEEDRSV